MTTADPRATAELQPCAGCSHPLAEHYASGCGWCICKVAGTATEDADSVPTTAARSLPSYGELMASLEGTTDALGRLVDAVRGLFDSAGKQAGYDEAVAELRAAHNAAIDWFQSEVTRHGT